jgi:hypothetical protein
LGMRGTTVRLMQCPPLQVRRCSPLHPFEVGTHTSDLGDLGNRFELVSENRTRFGVGNHRRPARKRGDRTVLDTTNLTIDHLVFPQLAMTPCASASPSIPVKLSLPVRRTKSPETIPTRCIKALIPRDRLRRQACCSPDPLHRSSQDLPLTPISFSSPGSRDDAGSVRIGWWVAVTTSFGSTHTEIERKG